MWARISVFSLLFYCFAIVQIHALDVQHLGQYDHCLSGPQRMAIADDGRMLVSEPGWGRVLLLDANGEIIHSYRLAEPMVVGFDPAGHCIISSENRLAVWDENGVLLAELSGAQGVIQKPGDLAVHSDGRTFVSDSGANCVHIFDASGAHVMSFGQAGSGAGEFYFPTGIALDEARQRILVADQGNARIQIFDLSGNFLSEFGRYTEQVDGEWIFRETFTRIQGLAVDEEGRVYVADSFQNNIQVLSSTGEFIDFISTDESGDLFFLLPMDLELRNGQLFCAASADKSIDYFAIGELTSLPDVSHSAVPQSLVIHGNKPNPFNPSTTLHFETTESGSVSLRIWNMLGEIVFEQYEPFVSSGVHMLQWEGNNQHGQQLASGVYIYALLHRSTRTGQTRNEFSKMLLLK